MLEVTTTTVAAGGAAIARADDGRVVFVHGALPGERVRAEVTAEHTKRLDAVVAEVLDAAPARREPPCPAVARGCGGCGWQHVRPDAQGGLKVEIVRDALARIGHLPDVDVREAPPLPDLDHRTTVRLAVDDGRVGFRAHHTHDVVAIDACPVAHPLIDEVLAGSTWGEAKEVTIRVGARTGERLVLADPTAAGVAVPDGVRLVGRDELDAGKRAWIHEEVGGRRFRVSARSFFQARPDGAEQLVDLVLDGLGDVSGRRVVDLYAGIGLFAAFAVERGAEVTAVEWSASAVADARVNLADGKARVVRSDVDRWRPHHADAVIADPARTGLGKRAARSITRTNAATLALVSCDPASLARDARFLVDAGYEVRHSTLVDLFPNTPHIEAVTIFDRA